MNSVFSFFFRPLALLCVSIFLPLVSAHADVTGYWICHFDLNGSGDYPQDISLTQTGGTVTGQEFQTNTNTPFANITGTASGNTFDIRADYISSSYYALINGTRNGNTLSGTWHNDSQVGGFSCTLRDGGGTGGGGQPGEGGGMKESGIAVMCNRGPDPKDNFRCTATVQAKDKTAPNPSGTVNFTSTKGSFPYSNTCLLTASSAPNTTSSCAVTLAQAPDTIPAGTVIPITGLYLGDTVYATSESVQPNSTVAGIPKRPKVCFSDVPKACDGLNALFKDFNLTQSPIKPTVHIDYFGPNGAGYQPRAAGRSPSVLVSPKSSGDIAVQVQLVMKGKSNSAVSSSRSLQRLKDKLKAGLVLASYKGKLKFGESKDVVLKTTKNLSKVVSAANDKGVSSLNLQLKIEVLRKRDTKSKVFSGQATATVGK